MADLSRQSFYRIDWIVVLAIFSIAALGLPYLHSASAHFFRQQIMWIALGVAAMVTAFFLDYEKLIRYAYLFYAIALTLLVVVLLLPPIRNAHSWIRIPGLPFSIQPTEIMKLALVLALARHLHQRENQSTLRGLFMPFVLTLLPMALILKQPDLGSAILLPFLLFTVIYVSGARVTHLLTILVTGIASSLPMWMFVMRDYQKRRILAFLDPQKYEAREGYHLIMSLIAIGSGGLYGEGIGQGSASSLDLLPDKHNDFIFGVIAEEGGFVIAGLFLVLFMVLVLGGFNIAYNTKEPAGRLVAAGVAAIIGGQVLVNVGVVTAALPTTGITLPLVSYGGSSMIITFAMVGLLLNVGASRPIVVSDSFTGPVDSYR